MESPLIRAAGPARYLTFRIARQDFALDASRVRGVLALGAATPHDGLPWLFGFAPLQGRNVPVIDLQKKLGVPRGGPQGRVPCVVIVESAGENAIRLIGFVADTLSEILCTHAKDHRNGAVKVRGRRRTILNPDQLLSKEESQSVEDCLRLSL